MTAPMDAIRLKVKRATEHFNNFKAALNIGDSAIGPPRTQGIHLQDDWTLKYSTDSPVPGPEAGIILGDAIHQLRSALDHLICALVVRTHNRLKCTDVNFPIHKTAKEFADNWRISQGVLEALIGSSELAQVELSQPYKRNPTNPIRDPLYILGQLDNIDKHRIVLMFDQRLKMAGSIESGGVTKPFSVREQPVKPGTQVLDVGWPLPDPPFGVQVDDMTTYVVLTETDGVADNRRVLGLFREMRRDVTAVLDEFNRFF